MQSKSLIYVGLSLLLLPRTGLADSQPPPDKEPARELKPSVSINEAKAFKGYTLVAPLNSTKTHIVDMDGRIVHTWESASTPALIPHLLDNGNLLRGISYGTSPSQARINARITTSRVCPMAMC
jgi:hypothetical protein